MINAIIVEDEVHLLRHLQRKLALLWPELRIVAACQNGRVALDAIRTFQPQLVFLDIQLGDIDGLRLAETLPRHCALVFVTAFADFALPAFEQGALDYLLKPYSEARLGQCLQKVQCYLSGLQHQTQRAHLPQAHDAADGLSATPLAQPAVPDITVRDITSAEPADTVSAPLNAAPVVMGQAATLALNIGQNHWLQPISEVRVIQAQGRYVAVVCPCKTALLRQSFQHVLQQCAAFQFVQVHRSVAINLHYLDYVKISGNKQMMLYIRGLSEPVRVSRRFQAVLRRHGLPPQAPARLAFGDTRPDQSMRHKLRL